MTASSGRKSPFWRAPWVLKGIHQKGQVTWCGTKCLPCFYGIVEKIKDQEGGGLCSGCICTTKMLRGPETESTLPETTQPSSSQRGLEASFLFQGHGLMAQMSQMRLSIPLIFSFKKATTLIWNFHSNRTSLHLRS